MRSRSVPRLGLRDHAAHAFGCSEIAATKAWRFASNEPAWGILDFAQHCRLGRRPEDTIRLAKEYLAAVNRTELDAKRKAVGKYIDVEFMRAENVKAQKNDIPLPYLQMGLTRQEASRMSGFEAIEYANKRGASVMLQADEPECPSPKKWHLERRLCHFVVIVRALEIGFFEYYKSSKRPARRFAIIPELGVRDHLPFTKGPAMATPRSYMATPRPACIPHSIDSCRLLGL